jgi:hypothetical protein
MGKSSGEKWAESYHSRPLDFNSTIGNMTFLEAHPIFTKIENVFKNTKRVTNLTLIKGVEKKPANMQYHLL